MAKCYLCEKTLNSKNTVLESKACITCQTQKFRILESHNGTHLAIFLCCAAFDLPCIPTLVDINLAVKEGEHWQIYCDALKEKMKLRHTAFWSFASGGETDIHNCFGRELSQTDFAKYIEIEELRSEKNVGTEEQRNKWGVGELTRNFPFTVEIYFELDRQYELWCDRYKGQTLTPQLQESIVKICKWNLQADLLAKAGNFADAQKIQNMVQKEMESEQMRKKDEKPVEDFRIDSQIACLEKAGFIEKGAFLNFEKTAKVIADNFAKKRKYDYSIDVADDILLDTINVMRRNADKDMLTELSDELRQNDINGEFNPEETEDEKERKQFAGIVPQKKVK